MASKTAKAKSDSKQKMDTHQRRMKWLQIIFVVISIMLITTMLLSAFINQ
jgi:predicted nucleic acid-binding Zn ribbon protein